MTKEMRDFIESQKIAFQELNTKNDAQGKDISLLISKIDLHLDLQQKAFQEIYRRINRLDNSINEIKGDISKILKVVSIENADFNPRASNKKLIDSK